MRYNFRPPLRKIPRSRSYFMKTKTDNNGVKFLAKLSSNLNIVLIIAKHNSRKNELIIIKFKKNSHRITTHFLYTIVYN